MATFSMGSIGDISLVNDFPKAQAYLYRLEKQLRYMFANLDPDENYSENARLVYVANAEKQASLEISLDQISLSMVTKDNVVSAINLSEGGVKINGEKISLEGVTTFNNNVTIGLDGTIHANNGEFSGYIAASDISGSNISGSKITAGGNDDSGITVNDQYGNLIGIWNKSGITIKKGSIEGATLKLGGSGTAGSMTVYDGDGNTIGTFGAGGITITNGSINAGKIFGSQIVLGGTGTSGGSLLLKNSSDTVLASMDTTTGLTINKGTIKGTSLELGGLNNTNGTLTVKNASGQSIATWNNLGLNLGTGTITGGTINGTDINVGGSGYNGTITLSDASGNPLATMDKVYGLRVYKGSISGTSLELGGLNNTYGTLTIKNASGTPIGIWDNDGINISSGEIHVGQFYTDGDYTSIGPFQVVNNSLLENYYCLATEDMSVGISSDPDENSNHWIWAGWDGQGGSEHFDFYVERGGDVYANDFCVIGRTGSTTTLVEALNDISTLDGDVNELFQRVGAIEEYLGL